MAKIVGSRQLADKLAELGIIVDPARVARVVIDLWPGKAPTIYIEEVGGDEIVQFLDELGRVEYKLVGKNKSGADYPTDGLSGRK